MVGRAVRALSVVSLLGVVLFAYVVWARPAQLRWGATVAEVDRPMPGDRLHPTPEFLATRAITIEGTPNDVWPWLVQMGYGRAGFYGYDIVENVGSARGIRSADRIVPELQHLGPGDELPLTPVIRLRVHALEANRFVVWAGEGDEAPGVFAWALYPVNDRQTRLVSRVRWSYHWSSPVWLALELFTEFTDHLAVRKILQGVKNRVEGNAESLATQNVELATYVLVFTMFVLALALQALRRPSWRGWLAALGAGAAWLITWYAPIPPWTGTALGLLVGASLLYAFRAPATDVHGGR